MRSAHGPWYADDGVTQDTSTPCADQTGASGTYDPVSGQWMCSDDSGSTGTPAATPASSSSVPYVAVMAK